MRLRLALTITGGVSLGSFEAGAVAALIAGLRPLCAGDDPPVRIDVIGGTSAGAITGLLASRCLLEGLDPIRVMEAGWVALPSLATLRDPDHRTPLTAQGLRDAAVELIAVPRDQPGEPSSDRQQVPVRLGLALTNLRGLEYYLARPNGRPPLRALTHMDWTAIELRPGLDVAAFTEPAGGSVIDAVLASAANALGFPPVLIDRRLDRDAYVANGIRNFPESGYFWYTDGGTVDREPFGRTLDMSGLLDRDADEHTRRIQVLIHPDPTSSPTGNQWADPDSDHRFLDVLSEVQRLQGTQTLYDDLRSLLRTNSHLSWLKTLSSTLGTALADLDPVATESIRNSLLAVAATIGDDRRHFHDLHTDDVTPSADVDHTGRREQPRHIGAGAAAEAHVVGERPAAIALRHVVDDLDAGELEALPLTALFDRVVAAVAGLSGKQSVALEVISPEPISTELGLAVDDVLAGAFLGHFGGFLDERLRASDFDLGYESALRWMESDALGAAGLDQDTVTRIATDARAAKVAHDRTHRACHPAEPWRRWGGASTASLPRAARLAAARTAISTARIAVRDLLSRGRKG